MNIENTKAQMRKGTHPGIREGMQEAV